MQTPDLQIFTQPAQMDCKSSETPFPLALRGFPLCPIPYPLKLALRGEAMGNLTVRFSICQALAVFPLLFSLSLSSFQSLVLFFSHPYSRGKK